MTEQEILPIQNVLAEINCALTSHNRVLLIAPPGAGKSTILPLKLLTASWQTGQIIMLEPRRLAARAVAARMASLLGEELGETVGYQTRFDHALSKKTRIVVVTERILSNMIVKDPELSDVSMVIFDEFHERSLDADFALALALDSQSGLRPDLRLLIMSATLAHQPISDLLGRPPVIKATGRSYKVELRYAPKPAELPLEQAIVREVNRCLRNETGNILVFLPGQREIERTVGLLQNLPPHPNIIITPLYGALDSATQNIAIAPTVNGQRKIVVATSIAETSLTIEDVRIVIDSGLARHAVADPSTGLSHLITRRASQAAVDQRAGRAGRTNDGIAIRLWSESQNGSLEPFSKPEILTAELSGFVLDCAAYGVRDPSTLLFLDPPPQRALSDAYQLLQQLDALDSNAFITPKGRKLRSLPFNVRLANMILWAQSIGHGYKAILLAIMLSERGLGGCDCDLDLRLERLEADNGVKARKARSLAKRLNRTSEHSNEAISCGELLLKAFPERVAKLRGVNGQFLLASGQGAIMDSETSLAKSPFVLAVDVVGSADRSRLIAAAALTEQDLRFYCQDKIRPDQIISVNRVKKLVQATAYEAYGAIRLRTTQLPTPSGEAANLAIIEAVKNYGIAILPWDDACTNFINRVNFLRRIIGEPWPAITEEYLNSQAEDWLSDHLTGQGDLSQIPSRVIEQALEAIIPYPLQRQLEKLAPLTFPLPNGRKAVINYIGDYPSISVPVQNVFGLTEHPMIVDSSVSLSIELLSPAGRPIQTTKDLPAFWLGSWKEVRKEMRGRYPKHDWPENPAATVVHQRKTRDLEKTQKRNLN